MVAFNASKWFAARSDVNNLDDLANLVRDSPNLDTVAVVLSATRRQKWRILAASAGHFWRFP